jgi:hypothetical protein
VVIASLSARVGSIGDKQEGGRYFHWASNTALNDLDKINVIFLMWKLTHLWVSESAVSGVR